MSGIDDYSITLHSSCHQIFTITHVPVSFMTMMVEFSSSCQHTANEEPNNTLRSIKDHILLWLNRNNGNLIYQQVDVVTKSSHPCSSPMHMTFEQILWTLSKMVYHGLFSKQDDKTDYTFNIKPPSDNLPFISLTGQCRPQITLNSTCRGFSSFQQFLQSHLSPVPTELTKDNVRWNLLTWMNRFNSKISVRNCHTYHSEQPISITPSLDVIVKESMALMVSPMDADSNVYAQCDEGPTFPSEESPVVLPTTPIIAGPPQTPPSMSYWRARQNSPTAYILTRQRKTVLCHALLEASVSKGPIDYDDGTRHMPGQPALTKPPIQIKQRHSTWLNQSTINNRLVLLDNLLKLRETFKRSGLDTPRDTWEDWINDNLDDDDDDDADRAFMCLIIILMSSNTSDKSLSQVVPRLFQAGITSATGTIKVANYFGMDVFCSLLSECGKFRQNAERIVNCADYFIQRHNGTIPSNISLQELLTLPGIGYKTAIIILHTAFNRNEGIPSDVHVIRATKTLNWTPTNVMDGLECSLGLQSWLPNDRWQEINPLFGALGQLLNKTETRKECHRIMEQFIKSHTEIEKKHRTPLRFFFQQLIAAYE